MSARVACYSPFSLGPSSAQAFLLDRGDHTAVSIVTSIATLSRKFDLDHLHILYVWCNESDDSTGITFRV